MLTPQLTIPQWLQIPMSQRMKIVKIFNLPRSGGTVVQDNTVITDGYTHEDLALITVEKLQEYLKEKEQDDLFALLNLLTIKLQEDEAKEIAEREAKEAKLKAHEVEEYKAQVVETVKNLTSMTDTVIKRREEESKK